MALLAAAAPLPFGCAPHADSDGAATNDSNLDIRPNWALGRPTTQSSTGFGGLSSRAVDGNTDGNFFDNSVSHTNLDSYPYWQVDLGASRFIDEVEIWNRTDCCSDRLHDFFVFFKDTPFVATNPSDLVNEDGVTWKANFGVPTNPLHMTGVHRKARFVRIALGSAGYLSLAEVRVWGQQLTIDGPDALATQTSWVPTGIVTDETALSIVEAKQKLYVFHRGADGLLHVAPDVAGSKSAPVAGSPAITTDGVAATFDAASSTMFVAVQTPNGMRVASAPVTDSGLGAFTWEDWGPNINPVIRFTTMRPAIAVGCGRVFAGAHFTWGGGTLLASRPTSGGAWIVDGQSISSTDAPPALAVNARGDIAHAQVSKDDHKVHYEQYVCATKTWTLPATLNATTTVPIGRVSVDDKVSLTAIGNRFGAAIRGDGDQALFMMQSWGSDAQPAWPTEWEPMEVNGVSMYVEDAPTLVTFRGLVIASGRNTGNSTYYAIRNPNTLVSQFTSSDHTKAMWIGNRVVGGWGTAATPPAFASTGRSADSGRDDVHQELFVVTRGIGDRQIYGLNMARFMAIDLLRNVWGVNLDTAQLADGVTPGSIPNIFDYLQVSLFAPWKYTRTLMTPCGNQHLNIMLDTHDVGGQTFEWCSPFTRGTWQIPGPTMRLSGRNTGWGANAKFLWGEFGHMVSWTSLQGSDFTARFGGSMLEPKACNTDADCGGAHCGLGKEAGADAFDDPTPVAWVNKNTCMVDEGPWGKRLMGFVISNSGNGFYDTTQDQHNYLYLAEAYRWHGDWLRRAVARDAAYGDTRLQVKYAFVKATYDGVEFNGELGNEDDETLGGHAMPLSGGVIIGPPPGVRPGALQ
jgi:hypothetical protein